MLVKWTSDGSVGKLPKNIFNFFNSSWISEQKLSIDLLLNPSEKDGQIKKSKQSIERYKLIFDRINKSTSLPFIFSSLWYSTMPCFDVKGVTSDQAGQVSISPTFYKHLFTQKYFVQLLCSYSLCFFSKKKCAKNRCS